MSLLGILEFLVLLAGLQSQTLEPSKATTAKELAQKMGFSDKPMQAGQFKPFGEIPQSDIAGLGIDLGLGVGASALGSSMMKGAGKGLRSILGGDDTAIRAIALRPKDIRTGIKTAGENEIFKNVDEISSFAKKNVLSPFSSTEEVLEKTKSRLESVGKEIGEIRKRSADKVEEYLLRNAGKPNVENYFDNVFRPKLSYLRIKKQIDNEIADPDYAQRVMSVIENKLNSLQERYGDAAVPMEKMTSLKSNWQREISAGKESADYTIREDAFKFLNKDLNQAINNEISLYDKILKGDDLAKHTKLKRDYGLLSLMNDSISARAAKEATASGPITLNPMQGFRTSTGLQSAVATGLPENAIPNPKWTAIGAGAIGSGRILSMGRGEQNEPKIEGYSAVETMQIAPIELPGAKAQIENSSLSSVEKAKRLNLLNKHGRVYLGQ
jgi:hypothetical protein